MDSANLGGQQYTPFNKPPATNGIVLKTSTKTRLSLSTKVMVSLAILGATGGFAAAMLPTSGEVQPYATTIANYSLSATKSGTGAGTITSSPTGISCGTACSAPYPSGTSVTLTATPQSGSVFMGWSSNCQPSLTVPNTCTVTMDAQKLVTAEFLGYGSGSIPLSVFRIRDSSIADGTITSNPTGINCGPGSSAGACNLGLNYVGTKVTLTATPQSGSVFMGWSSNCQPSLTVPNTCTVTMDAQKLVTAEFSTGSSLFISKSGTGSGTVSSTPAGINCGSTCSASYASATNVTLTATAGAGSKFIGWSGACSGASAVCTVTMSATKSVIANFTSASGTKLPATQ